MTLQRSLYRMESLGKNILSVRGGTAFLSSFGALWLATEVTSFFSQQAAQAFRASWLVFLAVGVLFAVLQCWPKLSFWCRLNNRDVRVEVRIGDIFDVGDSMVIATNTTFDTRVAPDLIAEGSLQGQFTKRYFGIGNEQQLDRSIDAELQNVAFTQLPTGRVGKDKRYPVGTTVLVRVPTKTTYLVALAQMNERGNASATPEDLRVALANLWVFISERGSKGHIAVPVLGSGPSRINLPRETIVQEIIRSFVAANAERTFCNQLTIVLSDADFSMHKVDFAALNAFLNHECTYTRFESSHANAVGTPVSESASTSVSADHAASP